MPDDERRAVGAVSAHLPAAYQALRMGDCMGASGHLLAKRCQGQGLAENPVLAAASGGAVSEVPPSLEVPVHCSAGLQRPTA